MIAAGFGVAVVRLAVDTRRTRGGGVLGLDDVPPRMIAVVGTATATRPGRARVRRAGAGPSAPAWSANRSARPGRSRRPRPGDRPRDRRGSRYVPVPGTMFMHDAPVLEQICVQPGEVTAGGSRRGAWTTCRMAVEVTAPPDVDPAAGDQEITASISGEQVPAERVPSRFRTNCWMPGFSCASTHRRRRSGTRRAPTPNSSEPLAKTAAWAGERVPHRLRASQAGR